MSMDNFYTMCEESIMTGKPTITPLDIEIGKNAKRIREGRNIGQDDAAETIGCSTSQLSQMENGKRAWSMKYLYGAALAYGVSPASFLGSYEHPTLKMIQTLSKKDLEDLKPTIERFQAS